VIEPGKLYTVNEARERLRAGQTTWDKLRRRGLPIQRVGAKSYVLGDDVIAAVASREGATDAN
jgi:hypothetical protein